MKKDTRVYIDDILESIMKIEEYVKPISEDEFNRNTLVQDAVFKRLEIIGEAVKNIPPKYHGKKLQECETFSYTNILE